MSLEPFIFLAVFLIFSLISFVLRWLKRELDGSADREAESKVYGLFQDSHEPFAYSEEKPPTLGRTQSGELSKAPATPKGKRKNVKIHAGNLQQMRQGIVLMTVLGPCRALEPPNESLRF